MCQRTRWLWRAIALTGFGLSTAPALAQAPSTDIWLAELRVSKGEIEVGRPEPVVRRQGYDNQPCFLRDGRGFLYSRGDSNGTDVYRYDRSSKKSVRLTETPESEYSPTPFTDGRDGFCAVRVESDGAQRLWRFDADGTDPRLVLAATDSVGYFAWLDKSTVALFVVGEPHTLRVVDVENERETLVEGDIGRSLLRIPRDGSLSFLIREPQSDPATYAFHRWSPDTGPAKWLVEAVGSAQDAAWIDDTLVMAEGTMLYRARPFDSPDWLEIADLGTYGVAGITRVAVSRDCRWIALVAAEAP